MVESSATTVESSTKTLQRRFAYQHFTLFKDRQYFKHDELIGLSIGISNVSENAKLADIESAERDVNLMHEALDDMNYDTNLKLLEPTYDILDLQFKEFKTRAQRNHKDGKKTVFFIYYSGHGLADILTHAVVNKADE